MLGLGQLGNAYQAMTNMGTIDIGDFDSFDAAYRWAEARYGNDFLGVAAVPAIKPPATPPQITTLSSLTPLLLVAAVLFMFMGKRK